MPKKKIAFQKASDIDYTTIHYHSISGRVSLLNVPRPERLMNDGVKARSERFASRRNMF